MDLVQKIKDEVYGDSSGSWKVGWAEHRQLYWVADEALSMSCRKDRITLMKCLQGIGSYNNFEPNVVCDILSRYFYGEAVLARVGSVCLFLIGKEKDISNIAEILRDKGMADEVDDASRGEGLKHPDFDFQGALAPFFDFENPTEVLLRVWWD